MSGKDQRDRTARLGGKALLLGIVLAVIVVALAIVFWPFQRHSVSQILQEMSDSQVQIRDFHPTYFPSPGCILDGVEFRHGDASGKPLITIEKLTIQGNYFGLPFQHISRVTAEGTHIVVPAGNIKPLHFTRSKITIGEIVADGTTLDFETEDPEKRLLRFDVKEARLSDVGWSGPLTYRVKVHTPEPPGDVSASGKFGVWNLDEPAKTPVSGEYSLEHADIGVFPGIGGTLSSNGKFDGTLGHVDVSGKTDTPNFEVNMGGHPVHLTTEFSAYVDATNGDTFLKRVDASFRKTRVIATGSIAKSGNADGKTALINLNLQTGRIEDIVGLFISENQAPMSGSTVMRGKVEIPPGEQPFLKKLQIQAGFGIGGAEFAQSSTQETVDKLSAGARGEKDPVDPATVLTDLKGNVALKNGMATFTNLSFGVPGASARMEGTFELATHKIDLHGQLQLDSKMSNTTNGAKALLLKMMDPLFKKQNKGEVLPVRISGTYDHPSFGLDIPGRKLQLSRTPAANTNAH
jgi:AsmA-like C-terminal region